MSLETQILRMIRSAHNNGRPHPTSKRFYGNLTGRGVSENDVDVTLKSMVAAGKIRIAAGAWYEVGDKRDTRKPRGPKKLDPKSAEARTLALPLYDNSGAK